MGVEKAVFNPLQAPGFTLSLQNAHNDGSVGDSLVLFSQIGVAAFVEAFWSSFIVLPLQVLCTAPFTRSQQAG